MSAAAGVLLRQPVTLPAPVGAPPAPAGFAPLAPLADIPHGLAAAPFFSTGALVVARAADGTIRAMGLYCPHKGAELRERAPRPARTRSLPAMP